MDEYITEGDDYVDWLQWVAIEKSKKFKGVFVIMHVLNPMHLDHANMQQVVPSKDERRDEIWNGIKFDQALGNNQVEELWTLLEDFKDVFA